MLILQEMFQQKNKINAPTLAYFTLNKSWPENNISGHQNNHDGYMYNNIKIDNNIPKESIKDLNKINDIVLRSSCQGELGNKKYPSFLIFRTINQDEKYVNNLIKNINKNKELKATYNIGNNGLLRVCIVHRN